MCGPEPSRRAARITAASPERRSRGACSASVTARAARRQRVAVGVGEAAGRRRRCVRRRRQSNASSRTSRCRDCVRCFAAPLAAATSELYLQGSVGRGGNGETPGDHTPKRWSSPDMRRPRRRAAVRHAAVRHAAARCVRGERRAAARREEARHAAARAGGGAERGAERSGRDVAWGSSRCRLEESSEAARARQRGSHLAKLRPGHGHTATGLRVRSRGAAGGGAAFRGQECRESALARMQHPNEPRTEKSPIHLCRWE